MASIPGNLEVNVAHQIRLGENRSGIANPETRCTLSDCAMLRTPVERVVTLLDRPPDLELRRSSYVRRGWQLGWRRLESAMAPQSMP
ncbi:hypothetical protein IF2G_00278 [Cordyceps javanica]|nr:hypothetical protein IF2G_00278 [Cordyceps javanica]